MRADKRRRGRLVRNLRREAIANGAPKSVRFKMSPDVQLLRIWVDVEIRRHEPPGPTPGGLDLTDAEAEAFIEAMSPEDGGHDA